MSRLPHWLSAPWDIGTVEDGNGHPVAGEAIIFAGNLAGSNEITITGPDAQALGLAVGKLPKIVEVLETVADASMCGGHVATTLDNLRRLAATTLDEAVPVRRGRTVSGASSDGSHPLTGDDAQQTWNAMRDLVAAAEGAGWDVDKALGPALQRARDGLAALALVLDVQTTEG